MALHPRYSGVIGAITTNQAKYATAITPSDSTDLTYSTSGLYVGGGGDIKVLFEGDTVPVTLNAVAAGVTHPWHIKRVYATGTTATGLIALY